MEAVMWDEKLKTHIFNRISIFSPLNYHVVIAKINEVKNKHLGVTKGRVSVLFQIGKIPHHIQTSTK